MGKLTWWCYSAFQFENIPPDVVCSLLFPYFLFCEVMENKSVVLASTAIQLMDDRKSPIVAGKVSGYADKKHVIVFLCVV